LRPVIGCWRAMCGIFAGLIGRDFGDVVVSLRRRGPDSVCCEEFCGTWMIAGAVLAMRGSAVVRQPHVVEKQGRRFYVLFNGEIYRLRGSEIEGNDTEVLAKEITELLLMEEEVRGQKLAQMMGEVEGPWSIVICDEKNGTIFFGKDRLGRRSLLELTDAPDEMVSILCSVNVNGNLKEIKPEGIYEISLSGKRTNLYHFVDELPKMLIKEPGTILESAKALKLALQNAVEIRLKDLHQNSIAIMFSGGLDCAVLAALAHLSLNECVSIDLLNVCFEHPAHQSPDRLSALATFHELKRTFPTRSWNLVCINECVENLKHNSEAICALVSPSKTHMDFNIGAALWYASKGEGKLYLSSESEKGEEGLDETIPTVDEAVNDLLTAKAMDKKKSVKEEEKRDRPCQLGLRECKCSCLAKANCAFSSCASCCKFHQRKENLFCNVHKFEKRRKLSKNSISPSPGNAPTQAKLFLSKARILLSGLGADEQLGGYGRHRVVFQTKGEEELRKELHREVLNLWSRNLGRDDRCISDHSREVRHPYLDERVMQVIRALPLSHSMDLALDPGVGDKRLLRIVCTQLGLISAARLRKRAIQFGTRIAQVSRAFAPGSNRSFDASQEFDPNVFQITE